MGGRWEIKQDLLGQSRQIEEVRSQARLVAGASCSVMLDGESGVGKEVVARLIHRWSPRRDQAFVPVDCTTLSDSLAESQLFGHVRGAFTGAERDAVGFIRTAHRGTLFLDEVGDLSPPVQAKLLRVLQEHAVTPVGSTSSIPVDVRVIAATNIDLAERVAQGLFREDLYYRVMVVKIVIAPLRERDNDAEMLFREFLGMFGDTRAPPKDLTADAWDLIRSHPWPGNVRELMNTAEAVSVLCPDRVVSAAQLAAHIPRAPELHELEPTRVATAVELQTLRLESTVRATVMLALRLTGGNQVQAAELLGIDRKTLARKIKRLGIDPASL